MLPYREAASDRGGGAGRNNVAYLIGIDEAGYGPNLGPLTITATLWELPDATSADDLYSILGVDPAAGNAPDQLRIADSKQVYQRHTGLVNLERNLLAASFPPGEHPEHWSALWQSWAGPSLPAFKRQPWYAQHSAPLPQACESEQIRALATKFTARQQESGVALRRIASRAVCPPEFNQGVATLGGKGQALSRWTLELLAQLLDQFLDQPAIVHCDRHGGRKRYASLLQDLFPDELVRVRNETSRCSRYQFRHAERDVDISFTTRGEESLPAALASMASKYLRELAMQAFNQFWSALIPTLRPTAGYPVDAKRFRQEVAARQKELGISDLQLWREC